MKCKALRTSIDVKGNYDPNDYIHLGYSLGRCNKEVVRGLTVCINHAQKDTIFMLINDLYDKIDKLEGGDNVNKKDISKLDYPQWCDEVESRVYEFLQEESPKLLMEFPNKYNITIQFNINRNSDVEDTHDFNRSYNISLSVRKLV